MCFILIQTPKSCHCFSHPTSERRVHILTTHFAFRSLAAKFVRVRSTAAKAKMRYWTSRNAFYYYWISMLIVMMMFLFHGHCLYSAAFRSDAACTRLHACNSLLQINIDGGLTTWNDVLFTANASYNAFWRINFSILCSCSFHDAISNKKKARRTLYVRMNGWQQRDDKLYAMLSPCFTTHENRKNSHEPRAMTICISWKQFRRRTSFSKRKQLQ